MTSKTPLKIAAAGIAIECATFSSLPSDLSDFNLLRGADLLSRYPFAARYADIEFRPIMQANALPGQGNRIKISLKEK